MSGQTWRRYDTIDSFGTIRNAGFTSALNRPEDNRKDARMSLSHHLFQITIAGLILQSWSGMTSAIGDEVSPDSTPTETDAAEERVADEWKPRLALTLYTTLDGIPKKTTQKVKVPYYKLSYEDVEQNGKTERHAIRHVGFHERDVTVAKPAGATLFCDAVIVDIASQENELIYAFECTDRLQLRFDGMVIDGDSGKLVDGNLELVNAKMTHNGTELTSEKMNIALSVRGLKTSEFGMPVPPTSCDLIPPALHPNGPAMHPLPMYRSEFEEIDADAILRERNSLRPQPDSDFAPRAASKPQSDVRFFKASETTE